MEIHRATPPRKLPVGFALPKPLPITAGQVHFLRAVDENRHVLILNKVWFTGFGVPEQGVWATLALNPSGATLRIYDATPDAPKRRCLADHPFPLNEPVVPLQTQFETPRKQTGLTWWQALLAGLFKHSALTPSTMS